MISVSPMPDMPIIECAYLFSGVSRLPYFSAKYITIAPVSNNVNPFASAIAGTLPKGLA